MKIENLDAKTINNIVEIYGKFPEEPEGYEFVDFRTGVAKYWLLKHGGVEKDGDLISPRLILEKKEIVYKGEPYTSDDVYPKGYIIPDDYEFVNFGIKPGRDAEYFIAANANVVSKEILALKHYHDTSARIFLKKRN